MNREEILHTDNCWTTSDEINVIDYIASPKRVIAHDSEKVSDVTIKVITKAERKRKLINYIQSCHKRADWGQINKVIVELYAQETLAKL
tara:strand:- start:39 stop:305 length:267 start_codon:yes stop_codon:yes gene_type:complete